MDKNFNDLKIGDSAFFERLVTKEDVEKFANLSGDYNPLHFDEKYAAKTKFKGPIVHGLFLGALVSRLIGMELPGQKTLLLKTELEFKKPARVGDKVLVKGQVVHKSLALKLLEISIEILKGQERLVAGSAHVQVL